MSDKYILDGHDAVPCDSIYEWSEWFERGDRLVAKTERDGVTISTVFLGLDHSFGGATPVLFETMVFGGPLDGEQQRYGSWTDAETGHAAMVARAFP